MGFSLLLLVFFLFHYNEVLADNQTFEDFVNLIDDQYCGQSTCSYTASKRMTPNPLCRECSCEFKCFSQQNCCPTTAFKYRGIYEDDKHTECIPADLTGRVTNSTQYYRVVSKCPPDYHDGYWQSSCENITDNTPLRLVPVLGWSKGVNQAFYRNIFCAGCNSVLKVEPFSILATCKRSDIFLQAQSEIDVYQLAMKQSDCHLDVSFAVRVPDSCYPNDKYLIRSCNVSGLWRERDTQIESGCLLEIYKVPVKNKYYNIFCYLCNTDKDLNVLMQEEPENETKYIQPEAFLDNLPQTKVEKDLAWQPPYVCFEGDYFIDLKGRCFNISCAVGKVFNGIACESPIHTNIIGYEFCFELQVDTGQNIEKAEAELYLKVLMIAENTMEKAGFRVTSIRSFQLEQWTCDNSTFFKQQSLLSVVFPTPIKREWLIMIISDVLKTLTFKLPHRCGHINYNNCLVEFISGTNRTENYTSGNTRLSELSKHVLFVPFSRLDSCCQILLTEDYFLMDNKTQNLLLYNSNLNLAVDDYILNENGTVTICLSDLMTKYAVICQADDKIRKYLSNPKTQRSDGVDENQLLSNTTSDNLNYSLSASSTVKYGMTQMKSEGFSSSIMYSEIYFMLSHCILLFLVY